MSATAAVKFLYSFAQALSTMNLYQEGHPARERAIDGALQHLHDLQDEEPAVSFMFIEDEVVLGRQTLRELRDWDWVPRLTAAGVQRLEFLDRVEPDDFQQFLSEVLARLTKAGIDTTLAREMRQSNIRFGEVGIRGEIEEEETKEMTTATISYSLGDEVEAVEWMHNEIQQGSTLPLVEAEAVVRSLSIAMHSQQELVVPLLQLKEFDQYTTTHSMNVSVLTMALGEFIGLGDDDVRAFGVAGLLHDLGKVKIPMDVLTKPGKLSDAERALMNRHPVDGAKLILETETNLDLAAIVAYEHHIMLNGGGYPTMHYPRDCHQGSKLVHVCDVYDALRTKRPYRGSWPSERILTYMEERSGIEFDAALVTAFSRMIRKWEPQMSSIDEARPRFSGASRVSDKEQAEAADDLGQDASSAG